MKNFIIKNDGGQEKVTASNYMDAAQIFGIPSTEEIKNGAFLVVFDTDTLEEYTWGYPDYKL